MFVLQTLDALLMLECPTRLRILGNIVVPAQAAAGMSMLVQVARILQVHEYDNEKLCLNFFTTFGFEMFSVLSLWYLA